MKQLSPDLVFDRETFLPRAISCRGKQLAGYVPDYVHAMNRDVTTCLGYKVEDHLARLRVGPSHQCSLRRRR